MSGCNSSGTPLSSIFRTSTMKEASNQSGNPNASIHFTPSPSQPDANKINIRFMSDEYSGNPEPLHEINNAVIRFTSNDMLGVHFAVENLLENFKSSIFNQIEQEIEQKYKNELSLTREQNLRLENEKRELKSSISEAIDEIMTLKRDKQQFSNEVLKVYTTNLAIVAENEQLKKEAQNKEMQYQKVIQTMNRNVSSNIVFRTQ